jgi:hypothetical protein
MSKWINFLRGTPTNSTSLNTIVDFEDGAVSLYNLDSSDTTSAGGIADHVGTNDGTATGFDNYTAAVTSGFPMKGWYSFDSVATDASGMANDLTATDITYVAGKLGNAASFNGTTSRLQDAAFSITGRQTHTLAVWVYVTDLSSQRTIVSFGLGYAVYIQTDGRVGVEMNSATTNSRRVFSTNTVSVNTWTHIVVVETGYSATNQARTQAEIGIWINGVQESTTTSTITASTADSAVLNVGCYNAASNYFQGYMDDLRIYAYIVSAQDIADIYNAGSGTTSQVLQPTWVPGTVNTWARNIRGGWSSGDKYSLGTVSNPAKLQMTEATSQTYSFWIYPRSIHGLVPIVSCAMFARGLQGLGFNFQYTASSVTITAYARIGGTGTTVSRQVADVSLDAWHHVVLRYDASGQMLYLHVDGSSDAGTSTSTITAFNLTSPLVIGDQVVSGNQTGTNAYVDELRVYNRLLTTTEVATLYAKEEVAQGLILKYSFEEGTGNNLNDTYNIVEGPNTIFTDAWNLDGTGEYISAPSTGIGQYTGTFACWFKPNVSSATWGDFYLFDTATARHAFHSQANDRFEVYNDTRLHRYTVSVSADWHRFVVVYDKDIDRQDLYIDGVKQTTIATTSGTWGTNVPGTAYIGSRFSASGTAPGQMAGVVLSSRAWSDEEVALDYSSGGFDGTPSGTVDTANYRIGLNDGEQIIWRTAYNSKDTYSRALPFFDEDSDRTNMVFSGGSANTVLSISTDGGSEWVTTPNKSETVLGSASENVLLKVQASGTAVYWKTSDARGHDRPIILQLR